jgi:acetoin utilization deacetylase AcuC-like enzyme
MKLYYTGQFVLPLPPGHRFPMEKYAMLRDALLASGDFSPADIVVPPAARDDEILRAHDGDYLAAIVSGSIDARAMRRIGFPWSAQMVERSRRSAGATLAACRAALGEGCAVNLAGGTHHAHRAEGSGFCVFNDTAIAALALLDDGQARRVAVIDCDVHQGDGTAAILAGNPGVFTFSIHGEKNFPFHKQRSSLDIELPDGTADAAYLAALETALAQVFTGFAPDFVIYLAGADPYADDRLGRLKLSRDGLAARDALVFSACARRHLPVAVSMAGGYARRIADSVAIHTRTVQLARQLAWRPINGAHKESRP